MTERDDDLIRRLSDADPIDPRALPTADDPTARQLLERIMTTDAADSPADSPIGDETPEVLDLPRVRGIDRYASANRRRGPYLAAVAAAILLIVGFIVFSPNNSQPALAAVHSAAQATAEIDSGRVTTTFDLVGSDGTSTGAVAGEVRAEFAGSDVAVELDLTSAEGEAAGLELPATEGRLVDGVLYTNYGSTWYAVETGTLIGQTVVETIDPRTVLTEVEGLLETTEIGPAEVGGVETTQYRSVVDLGDDSLRESGWLPIDAADVRTEGQLTVDLYVDDAGLLRRLDLTGDVLETGGAGSATIEITTVFTDLGADISIDAPADAVVLDPETDLDELDVTD